MNVLTQHTGVPIKAWTGEMVVEPQAVNQLVNVASLPFIFKHVAVMPDVHLGVGATIGSVIPTQGAIIPAAVGVDIGCGMLAVRLNLTADKLGECFVDSQSYRRGYPRGQWPGWRIQGDPARGLFSSERPNPTLREGCCAPFAQVRQRSASDWHTW